MVEVNKLLNNLIDDNINRINDLIEIGKIDTNDLTNEILLTNNPKLMYLAILYIKGISVGRIAHAIVKSRNAYYIYMTGLIPGVPVNDLAKGMIATQNIALIYQFARYVPGSPIDKLAMAMIKKENILTFEAMNFFYFLRDLHDKISLEIAKLLARKVVELKNPSVICAVAEYGILQVKEYIAGLKECRDDRLGCYYYLLARDCVCNLEDLNLIAYALTETENYDYIVKFILEISNSPYQILIDYMSSKEGTMEFLKCIALSEAKPDAASYAVDVIINLSTKDDIEDLMNRIQNYDLFLRLNQFVNSPTFNERLRVKPSETAIPVDL